MAKQKAPLRQNPYQTYRDPLTGKWMVIKSDGENSNPTSQAA